MAFATAGAAAASPEGDYRLRDISLGLPAHRDHLPREPDGGAMGFPDLDHPWGVLRYTSAGGARGGATVPWEIRGATSGVLGGGIRLDIVICIPGGYREALAPRPHLAARVGHAGVTVRWRGGKRRNCLRIATPALTPALQIPSTLNLTPIRTA